MNTPSSSSTPAIQDVTLTYDTDGGKQLERPISVSMSVSSELAEVFRRAVVINTGNPPPLSFSSLLISMMMGTDSVGSWLKAHLASQGVTIEDIAKNSSRSVNETAVLSAAANSSLDSLGATISACRAIEQAREIAAALGRDTVLDLRHVAAAYPILTNWHLEVENSSYSRTFQDLFRLDLGPGNDCAAHLPESGLYGQVANFWLRMWFAHDS